MPTPISKPSLEPQAQVNFAIDMGYNPTVTDAKIDAALRKKIGFTEEEEKRLVTPDYAFITKSDAVWKEWWDKEFKG